MLRRIPAEAMPGVVLFACAAVAMIVANSALGPWQRDALALTGSVGVGDAVISMSLASWVKSALMAIFFFYAGLELKRELREGALATPSKAMLPFAGAVGGMAAPALIYLLVTGGDGPYVSGWAIPAATDIAFALGALALLGSRVPASLKAFLLAVAVVDDLGAILIVAFVYTGEVQWSWLGWAGAVAAVMFLLNRLRVGDVGPYLLLAVPLWVCMQNSGVNPTVAGVLAAAFIPMRNREGESPLIHLEHVIRPYVLFGVMPVFALANAGVYLGQGFAAALLHPVALGIAAGLALGKPFGIAALTLLAARILKTPLPGTPLQVLGVGAVAGIGFTMSLFIGALAFADPALQGPVRVGVYMGSLAAGAAGLALLAWSLRTARAPAVPEDDPATPFLAEDENPTGGQLTAIR